MNKTFNKKLKITMTGLVAGISLLATGLVNAENKTLYTVKSGDTLSEIALTYNTTVDVLVERNNIANPNFIVVGQTIELDEVITSEESPSTTNPVEVVEPTSVETATTTVSSSEERIYSSDLSVEDAAAKEWIAQKESGGSYTAQNGIYIGRYQLTNTYLNGDYSPENQERVADAYVAGRYGSWSAAKAFWLVNGWY